MKKIFISMMAVAALAACAKTEVAYEAPEEINFKPVAGNVTKTAQQAGALDGTKNDLVVFASYQNKNATSTESYWEDPEIFTYFSAAPEGRDVTGWAGKKALYWPEAGKLAFAGYNIPKDGAPIAEAGYDWTTNTLTLTYTLANEFDFGYFTTTDYLASTQTVAPALTHALTWITFVDSKANGATVKEVVLKAVPQTAALTATPSSCKWNTSANGVLDALTAYTESNTSGVLVFPTEPLEVDVTFERKVGNLTNTFTKSATLTVPGTGEKWVNGKKYVYTISVSAAETAEIILAPTMSAWPEVPGGANVSAN